MTVGFHLAADEDHVLGTNLASSLVTLGRLLRAKNHLNQALAIA